MEHIGNVAKRLVEQARDRRAALAREPGADDMPEVQPPAKKETRSMSERDGHRGRGGVALLALRGVGR